MRRKATYQAAISVAEEIEQHFNQNLTAAAADGEINLAPQPPSDAIEWILDAAFWSSLRKEEGYSPKISIAYLPPEMASQALTFSHRFPLNANVLTKLAPGVERAGVHIGVWQENGELYIWGTTLSIPNYCLVVDVSEPGLLVVKHRRMSGLGKYTNVVILEGDHIKFVDDAYALMPELPPMLSALLDVSAHANWSDSANILIQLAVSMRAHGRGGALLVVPANTQKWRDSIVQPIAYSALPMFCSLSNLIKKNRSDASEIYWQTSLKRETDFLAGLTAIDGATVISDEFEVLCFGAKITRALGSDQVSNLNFSEPIKGVSAVQIHPGKAGGTRHFSAAQFVFDQRDSFALVASQDGHFTVFTWSANLNTVQAHRIETLLL